MNASFQFLTKPASPSEREIIVIPIPTHHTERETMSNATKFSFINTMFPHQHYSVFPSPNTTFNKPTRTRKKKKEKNINNNNTPGKNSTHFFPFHTCDICTFLDISVFIPSPSPCPPSTQVTCRCVPQGCTLPTTPHIIIISTDNALFSRISAYLFSS